MKNNKKALALAVENEINRNRTPFLSYVAGLIMVVVVAIVASGLLILPQGF